MKLPLPGSVSLEVKLPLLITALLVILLGAGLWVTYTQVRTVTSESALERTSVVASTIANNAVNNIGNRLTAMRTAARHPAIHAFLRGDDGAADGARQQLERLRVADLPVQLWAPDGTIILDPGTPSPEADWEAAFAPAARTVPDTGGISPFVFGARRAYFWFAVPVDEGGRRLGWLAQLRPVQTAGNADALQALIGDGLAVHLASLPGRYWLTASGERIEAPATWPFAGFAEYESGNERHIAFSQRVGETPIHIIAEIPETVLYGRSAAFLERGIVTAAVLIVVGALLAWLLSRTVTNPIKLLQAASQAIAAGDYSMRVTGNRGDELGSLARHFSVMAEQVENTQRQLARQVEEERALAAELEAANRQLRDAMETAEALRVEAQKASRAKSDFLANMSHEIRTPINAILGYVDLLDLGVAGPIAQKQREHLARIRASARHLVGLVDDVLDISGVESGRLQLEPREARMVEAIDAAISILMPRAMEKNIEIMHQCHCPDDSRYYGDPRRVEQIMLNLVENAIKFTANNGAVTIVCARSDDHDGEWREVTIEDNGSGIPGDQLDRIFEPFVQGDSSYTRAHGGVGLGLAIARNLARMMGGDITAASTAGDGSRFTIRLPVSGTAAADADTAEDSAMRASAGQNA